MEYLPIYPIGRIYTPHRQTSGMPIQPLAASGIRGQIELFPEYLPGLKDLHGFSHITLLYYFHKITGYELQVVPFMDTVRRGIFACRAPVRPNAIGMSTVRLIAVTDNRLIIEDVDMLNESPLLDIKPFYPRYDNRDNVRCGWLENKSESDPETLMSDARFSGCGAGPGRNGGNRMEGAHADQREESN